MSIKPIPRDRCTDQQCKYLRLGGHVQCGRRLVCYEKGWIAGQRGGKGNTLAHAAGQLERVLIGDVRIGDPHFREPRPASACNRPLRLRRL